MSETDTKELKTIREWFFTLPDGYRELALKNADSALKNTDSAFFPEKGKVRSLVRAIGWGFKWDSTPEGNAFWGDVYDWAYSPNYNELPPLPSTEEEETYETED
jgi:hypothetical protein